MCSDYSLSPNCLHKFVVVKTVQYTTIHYIIIPVSCEKIDM